MPDPVNLSLMLLFGAVGLGYFLYGKKQHRAVPLVCGLAMMVYPYFITNHIAMAAIGIALASLPYFVRL